MQEKLLKFLFLIYDGTDQCPASSIFFKTFEIIFLVYIYKKVAFIALEGDHIVIIFIISFAFTHAAEVRSTHWHPCSLSLRE